jgi:hypothetical protein
MRLSCQDDAFGKPEQCFRLAFLLQQYCMSNVCILPSKLNCSPKQIKLPCKTNYIAHQNKLNCSAKLSERQLENYSPATRRQRTDMAGTSKKQLIRFVVTPFCTTFAREKRNKRR